MDRLKVPVRTALGRVARRPSPSLSSFHLLPRRISSASRSFPSSLDLDMLPQSLRLSCDPVDFLAQLSVVHCNLSVSHLVVGAWKLEREQEQTAGTGESRGAVGREEPRTATRRDISGKPTGAAVQELGIGSALPMSSSGPFWWCAGFHCSLLSAENPIFPATPLCV